MSIAFLGFYKKLLIDRKLLIQDIMEASKNHNKLLTLIVIFYPNHGFSFSTILNWQFTGIAGLKCANLPFLYLSLYHDSDKSLLPPQKYPAPS